MKMRPRDKCNPQAFEKSARRLVNSIDLADEGDRNTRIAARVKEIQDVANTLITASHKIESLLENAEKGAGPSEACDEFTVELLTALQTGNPARFSEVWDGAQTALCEMFIYSDERLSAVQSWHGRLAAVMA